MKLILKMDMDNAAFDPAWELEAARILEYCATALRNGQSGGNLRDVNGNKVGRFAVLDAVDSKRAERKAFAEFLDKLLRND